MAHFISSQEKGKKEGPCWPQSVVIICCSCCYFCLPFAFPLDGAFFYVIVVP